MPLMPSRPTNAYAAAALRPKYANAFEDLGFTGGDDEPPAALPPQPVLSLPSSPANQTGTNHPKIFMPLMPPATPQAGGSSSTKSSRRGSASDSANALAPAFPSQSSPISPDPSAASNGAPMSSDSTLLTADQTSLLQGRSIREVLKKLESTEAALAQAQGELEALRQTTGTTEVQTVPPHARRASISESGSQSITPIPSPSMAPAAHPTVDLITHQTVKHQLADAEREVQRLNELIAGLQSQLSTALLQLAASKSPSVDADESDPVEDDTASTNLDDADEVQLLSVIRALRKDKQKLLKQFNTQRAQLKKLELDRDTAPTPFTQTNTGEATAEELQSIVAELARVKAESLQASMDRQVREQQFADSIEQLNLNLRAVDIERTELVDQVRTLTAQLDHANRESLGDTIAASSASSLATPSKRLRSPAASPDKMLVPVTRAMQRNDEDDDEPNGGDQLQLRALAQQLTDALAQLQRTNEKLEQQEKQLLMATNATIAASSSVAAASASSSSSSKADERVLTTRKLHGDMNVFVSCSRYFW